MKSVQKFILSAVISIFLFSISSSYAFSVAIRPYSNTSPWNTPISSIPTYDPKSTEYITALSGYFGSDPTQYTFPVYEVSSTTPLKIVKISGTFSNVTENGSKLVNQKGGTVSVPIPTNALAAKGSDAQIIIWKTDSGDEWGFWKAFPNSDGTWSATNGYHYNTNWTGVPPKGFISRGGGLPYLAGLIRPWEITQGRIDHAIAFAYDYPTNEYIYPATKSDGNGIYPDMPEGTKLQLDPKLTEADFDRWGLSTAGKIIARALQKYGMIIIDRSGHPKIYAEYENTAKWNSQITAKTVSTIPYSSFKVISLSSSQSTATVLPAATSTPVPTFTVTPMPTPTITPTPALNQLVTTLNLKVETLQKELEQVKQKQSLLEETLNSILNWIKATFP